MKRLAVLAGVLLVAGGLGLAVGSFLAVPFFANKELSMGITNLKLFSFQPMILYSYEKGGGVFVKVLYVEGKRNLRVGDLWLSGWNDGVQLDAVFYWDGKKAEMLESLGEVKQWLKFGTRVRVEYITSQTLLGSDVDPDNEACREAPRICQVYAYVKGKAKLYTDFSVTGYLPRGAVLPALGLMTELHK